MPKSKIKVYVVGRATNYANWVSSELVSKIEDADLVLLTGGEDVNPKYYGENPNPTTSFNDLRDVYEMEEINKAISLNKPLYGTCRGMQLLTVMAGGKLVQNQSNAISPHLFNHGLLQREIKNFSINNYVSNFLSSYDGKSSGVLGITYEYSAGAIRTEFNALIDKILNTSNMVSSFKTLSYYKKFLSNLGQPGLYQTSKFLNLEQILKEYPPLVTSAHHQAAYPYNLSKNEFTILAWTDGIHKYHQGSTSEELEIPDDIEIESIMLHKINAYGIQGHPEWMVDSFESAILNLETYLNSVKNTILKMGDTSSNSRVIMNRTINEVELSEPFIIASAYVSSYLHFLLGINYLLPDHQVFSSDKILNLVTRYQNSILKLNLMYQTFVYRKLYDNKEVLLNLIDSLVEDSFKVINNYLQNEFTFNIKATENYIPNKKNKHFPKSEVKKQVRSKLYTTFDTAVFDAAFNQINGIQVNNDVIGNEEAVPQEVDHPHIIIDLNDVFPEPVNQIFEEENLMNDNNGIDNN